MWPSGRVDPEVSPISIWAASSTTSCTARWFPWGIVPTRAAGQQVARLVVGVEGSAGSTAAVAFCATLAPVLDATVTAVYAYDPLAEWVPEYDPRSWHRRAEANVRDWIVPIGRAGVTVTVNVERDIRPVGALCRAIVSQPDTLAVVGARARGGISGLRHGRVPISLVHQSDNAVVMVPEVPREPSLRQVHSGRR